jgi:site-specific DNA recombinase
METAKSNEHKRAVIYCRVSTDEQAKGYSLSTQLEACLKYAEANGFEVIGTFKDDYSGATPIEARPEGRVAYDMLSRGVADVLIVYRIDRLVRPPEDGDEWDMPILIRSLAKAGREIHTLDLGRIETSFAGLLIAMLDGNNAGEEGRKIAERTTRGRTAKAHDQQVVGNGIFPYGYRKTGQGCTAGIEINAARLGLSDSSLSSTYWVMGKLGRCRSTRSRYA